MRLALLLTALLVGCQTQAPTALPPTRLPTPTPTRTAAPTHRPAVPTPTPKPVTVRYRIERHTTDAATADFAAAVDAALHDRRGWQRATFRLVHDQAAAYRVVIAEPKEVEALCRPYDVYLKYSCQNGPVVAINAERWRHATPKWTGTLAAYREMLINHEFGHLLGMHHPASPQCPERGQRARVMSQQSTELNGCLPNPWPLPSEVARAGRHDLPLAPPAQP